MVATQTHKPTSKSTPTPSGQVSHGPSHEQIVETWVVLEALHVSLGSIGRCCDNESEVRDALRELFYPEMVHRIGRARRLLSDHVTDAEAEALESDIPHWRWSEHPSAAADEQHIPTEAE